MRLRCCPALLVFAACSFCWYGSTSAFLKTTTTRSFSVVPQPKHYYHLPRGSASRKRTLNSDIVLSASSFSTDSTGGGGGHRNSDSKSTEDDFSNTKTVTRKIKKKKVIKIKKKIEKDAAQTKGSSLSASRKDEGSSKKAHPFDNPKKHVWSYAFLTGKRREEVLQLTDEMDAAHFRNFQLREDDTEAWFTEGLEILNQYAKLGEAEKAIKTHQRLMIEMKDYKLNNARKDFYQREVMSQRRAFNACLNEVMRLSWDHGLRDSSGHRGSRRPLFGNEWVSHVTGKPFSASPKKKEALPEEFKGALKHIQDLLCQADDLLQEMEASSLAYVKAATRTIGKVKRVPASILTAQDYSILLRTFCQRAGAFPGTSSSASWSISANIRIVNSLTRWSQLYEQNQYLDRLSPTAQMYVTVMKFLLAQMKTESKQNRAPGARRLLDNQQKQEPQQQLRVRMTQKVFVDEELIQKLGEDCLRLHDGAMRTKAKVVGTNNNETEAAVLGVTPIPELYETILESMSRQLPPIGQGLQQERNKKNTPALSFSHWQLTGRAHYIWNRLEGNDNCAQTAKCYTSMIYLCLKLNLVDEALEKSKQFISYLLAPETQETKFIDFRVLRHLIVSLRFEISNWNRSNSNESSGSRIRRGKANTAAEKSRGEELLDHRSQRVKEKQRQYAEEASNILQSMWALHQYGYGGDVRPDTVVYTNVMACWTDTLSEGALDKVQALLHDLQFRGNDGENHSSFGTGATKLAPIADTKCYGQLLRAISTEPNLDNAMEYAERVHEDMTELEVPLDLNCYNYLLKAYTSGGTSRGVMKAESVLRSMIKLGNPLPNELSFTFVIKALVALGEVAVAEKWLFRMEDRLANAVPPSGQLYQEIIQKWIAKSSTETQENGPLSSERAELLLLRMSDLYDAEPFGRAKDRLKPSWSLFNAVIDAAVKEGNDEGARSMAVKRDEIHGKSREDDDPTRFTSNDAVVDILQKLEQNEAALKGGNIGRTDGRVTSTNEFNVFLKKIADSAQAWSGPRAEDVLNLMLEFNLKRNNEAVRPNIVTFNIVMNAWTKSSHPDAGYMVERTLGKLDELQQLGLFQDVHPTRATYNTIIGAFAKSQGSDSAEKAEEWFRNLEAEYRRTKNKELAPNVASYVSLLNAWALKQTPEAAERAEALLVELIQEQKHDGDRAPVNTSCFNEVIFGWAKSGSVSILRRTEALLDLMDEMYRKGDGLVQPTTKSYNLVLLAAVNSRMSDAPKRANLILERMKESKSAKPDVVTYSTLLDLWGRPGIGPTAVAAIKEIIEEAYASGIHLDSVFFCGVISSLRKTQVLDATRHAQAIVDDLKQRYERGEVSLGVDRIIYNTLIDAWAKSGHPEAPEKAEEILQTMKEEAAKSSNTEAPMLTPNVQTYTAVIDCWARSLDPAAAGRAEVLLEEMDVRPNVYTYTAAINAIAKSDDPNKAERAKGMLDRMKADLSVDGENEDVNQHLVIAAYNALLNACEFTFGDVSDVQQAFKIACSVFDEMRASSSLEMDHVSYGSFLGVVAELIPPSEFRDEMVKLMFQRCIQEGQLGPVTLRKLRDAAGTPELYQEILEGRSLDQLPEEWSRNVREKRKER